MPAEDESRKQLVSNILALREHCRDVHSESMRWALNLQRKHKHFLNFTPLVLALVFFLDIPLLARVLIYFGTLIIIDLARKGITLYNRREQINAERNTDAEYELKVFEYLKKYYGANVDGLEYVMRPCNVYSFTNGKVKKTYEKFFDQHLVAEEVRNDVISTPDISNVLYFGSLNLHGANVDNIVIQLMPDQTIALLKDGVEIPAANV